MKILYQFLFCTILLTLITSCEKEEQPESNNENNTNNTSHKDNLYTGSITDISQSDTNCFSYPGNYTFPTYEHEDQQFSYPTLNYENDQEIIYYYTNAPTSEHQLIRYNLQTEQKVVLQNNVGIQSQPHWKNGTIVYNDEQKVTVIDENGGLTDQIQTNVRTQTPRIDEHNNRLIWGEINPNASNQPCLIRTYSLDTQTSQIYYTSGFGFNGGFHFYIDFAPDGQMIFNRFNNTLSYTVESTQSTVGVLDLESYFEVGLIRGLCWSRTSDALYFSVFDEEYGGGIYKLDFENNTLTRLVEHCPSKYYLNLSVSENDDFLIAQRMDSDRITDNQGDTHFISNSTIYKINLSTLEETMLDLE